MNPGPVLVDAHAHLDDEAFDGDRSELLRQIQKAGIIVVNAGSDLESSRFSLELARNWDFVYACVGVHPHEAKKAHPGYIGELTELARDPKVVAIGEIGLDYHYDFSPREVQKEVFEKQLLLAKDLGLPVVVHCREALSDVLEILKKSGVKKGLLHCYTGTLKEARDFLDLGFYFSFGGMLTFKKAEDLRKVAKGLPKERVLVETDCPYLSPEPFRGRRNDPTRLVYVVSSLARIWGISEEEVAEITRNNAIELFGLELI